MVFKERARQEATGYEYSLEEIFGNITFLCDVRLEGKMLDAIVQHIIGRKEKQGLLTIQVSDTPVVTVDVNFLYNPREEWEDEGDKQKL